MNYKLARRLATRTDNRDVDMNPEGLIEAQVKALIPTLTADNLSLLLEIEREGHNRPGVIEFAEAQLSKLATEPVADEGPAKEEEKPVAKKGKK